MQYVHFNLHTNYFLLPWKIPEGISRPSMLFQYEGSIYHIKHMSIQPFTMGVDQHEIGCLMEVSVMFDICTYTAFCICMVGTYSHVAK